MKTGRKKEGTGVKCFVMSFFPQETLKNRMHNENKGEAAAIKVSFNFGLYENTQRQLTQRLICSSPCMFPT